MEPFAERQSFGKKWWWILLLPLVMGSIISVVTLNGNDVEIWKALIPTGITIIVPLLLFSMQLHTFINHEEVSIRFSPFQRGQTSFKWSEVEQARVVNYDPLSEYGGWGIRKGWKRSKVAYNVWGSRGLELTLFDGKIVMIGTNQSEQMEQYLTYLKRKYNLTALDK